MKHKVMLAVSVMACAMLVPSVKTSSAGAAKQTVIRFASLAPNGSPFMTVLKAWNRTVQKKTDGRVKLQFYSGGSQGDERDFVRKIRAGQMDGAGITTVGLGSIVRSVLVLSVPGVVDEYPELEMVRERLEGRFNKMFDDAGFTLLAWGDGGKNRMFSTHLVESPSDLKSRRPWAWKDDPVYSEFIKVAGANAVALGLPEVYPGLQTGMVDTVAASALAAVALQWYTRLKYVSKQNINIIVGASIIKKSVFESLSPEDQEILSVTAKQAAVALDRIVKKDDNKSYNLLVKRGLKEMDFGGSQAAWDRIANKTKANLVGRVYSQSLIDAVESAVAATVK